VGAELGVPTVTDVHLPEQAALAARYVDMLQVPAFLSRQTDLLVACGKTGKAVNVKKGQFLSPWDMRHAVEKLLSTGNKNIMLTERGASFGYGNLVVDMRSYAIMRSFGFPVIHDATHCVQLPGGNGATTGGQREFVRPLARAAAAVGVDGVFFETHPDPDQALSDGPNSLYLSDVPSFLKEVRRMDAASKESR
jgi:2-dehydro-3-deoxyphosphooctonate aldolase (KDO 8-P synthase)